MGRVWVWPRAADAQLGRFWRCATVMEIPLFGFVKANLRKDNLGRPDRVLGSVRQSLLQQPKLVNQ
jgi:hypothetical protein